MTQTPGAVPPTLYETYRLLPRAVRWIIAAGIFSAVALFWSLVLDPARENLANQAARIEQDVLAVQAGQRFVNELNNDARKRQQITLLGPVSLPTDQQTVGERMADAIISVLDKHGTRIGDMRRNQGRRMPQTTAELLTGSSDRVVRLTTDLRFEADTETVIEILRDLEAHEHINAITNVAMAKGSGRRNLSVSVVVESWYREVPTFG